MNKILLLLLLVFLNSILIAQISIGGQPRSFTFVAADKDLNSIELANPINKAILKEDIEDKLHYRIGVSISAGFDLLSKGKWTTLPDGGKLCRLKISTKEALAQGVYFNDFLLPDGTELYIYSEDKEQVIGGYTSSNKSHDGYFATELIHGESLIIEYYEPEYCPTKAKIQISEIAYIYRGYISPTVKNTSAFGDSDPCEVNVNCSPEGNLWQDEKRGVARILLKEGSNYFWCTGSLVNNVRQNFDPYFLTADHCGHNASTSDYNQWIFYFNFETSECTNPSSSPSSNTITGCTKVASGGNSGSNGSDFKLLLFNSYVPTSYDPFYNGWNNINVSSSSGVGIHHPSGDVKKISTYTSSLLTSSWSGNYNAHWRVIWSATLNGHGVTEGGSSGSPIFNSTGAVIGTLTGGSSYCSTPTYPDYYGKFSYSWESNGIVSSARLKDWLDPDNTGTSILTGTDHIITISGLDAEYCINDSPDTLSGIPVLGTFSGTGIVGNVFNPVIAGVGTFSITYSTTAGNVSQTVIVNSLPILSLGPDQELITGQNIDLDAGAGFNSYLWSNNSTAQILNINQGGTFWVEVSNSYGCTATDTIIVTEISGLSPGWSYSNTGSNHSILVQDTIPVLINGVQIESGDYIGVFFDSTGVLACAGYIEWSGNTEALSAWGAQPGFLDGFAGGEEFKYKIWDSSADIEYEATATYFITGFPNQQYYATNGMSGLESLSTTSIQVQTISLNFGWGIFSTFINPATPNLDSIFSQIISNVTIVKDGNGVVFWPPYLNQIGDLTIGEGYQINLSDNVTLNIDGIAVIPENTTISVPSGWSIIGYLRQSPDNAITMLNSLTSEIIIVKNGNGLVYWPPYLNQIGNLIPGEGYQINLSSTGTLIYPPN